MISTNFLTQFWRSFVVVLTPLLLLPLVIYFNTKEFRCAYVILVMAVYWVTEAIPMAMTSLIPVFAFPLLGVVSTDDICYVYMKETNMMFIGGLMVAVAVEHCNLHTRIALFVILHLGQSPLQLMAGFMVTTMFLSMWISNTATTAMMIPIVDAILREFYRTYGKSCCPRKSDVEKDIAMGKVATEVNQESTKLESYSDNEEEKVGFEEGFSVVERTSLTATPPNESCRRFRDMFFLATAYGANLGGTGSYTGTGTNLVLKGILKSTFTEPTPLNFASWMLFNIPGMLLCGLLTFTWLQFYFLGFGQQVIRRMIQRKYEKLGGLSFHEKTVLFWFVVLVLLWFFLSPGFVTGWGTLFKHLFGEETNIDDASPAILIVFILFVMPSRPNFWYFRDPKALSFPSSSDACLTWKLVHEKIPWGIVLLIGGGFAIAKASQESGLSAMMGEQLRVVGVFPPEAILFCICLMTSFVTEITSNSATAAVLLPVLKDLSLALCLNPLFLMLPATLCCSFAFMLPVATPPNALVYGAANINSRTMIKAGIVPNFMCVLVVTIMINTLGQPILSTNEIPSWANSTVNGPSLHC